MIINVDATSLPPQLYASAYPFLLAHLAENTFWFTS